VFEKGMNDYIYNQRMAAIRQHADSFNWNRAVQEYLEVYRKLL